MISGAPQPQRQVLQVGELTRKIKRLIEEDIGWVWLEGEISNFSRAASGHLYFTLKDDTAQIRAAFFRGRQRGMTCQPKDGMKVRVYGQVSVYERSGQYQVLVSQLEDAGQGDLQAAFEALKQKLAAEGLFDPDRKKPLPMLPQRIGIVTSPTGAAIRDILQVLDRRFPNLHIQIAPVRVQGEGAAAEVARAIELFNEVNTVDVLIVGRGGGSLEDLWAFNEEIVARAIAASRLPLISAVGHEIDTSISDFVADLRAPTPSAAAELVVRPKAEFEAQLQQVEQRLMRSLDRFRLQLKNRYTACSRSWVFREPEHVARRHRQQVQQARGAMTRALRDAVQERQQRIDEAGLKLRHRMEAQASTARHRYLQARAALPTELRGAVRQQQQRLVQTQRQLVYALKRQGEQARHRFTKAEAQWRLLGPQAVLERGYSVTRDAQGRVVQRADQVAAGDVLETVLAQGRIESTINQTASESGEMT
jgi:exodeoxyribonuclease VII large subunit